MKRNFLSTKFLLTSIIFLQIALFWITAYGNNRDVYYVYTCPIVCFVLFLVFFILGWVIKDKPLIPKNKTEETKKEDK